jgi:hypothetical protein
VDAALLAPAVPDAAAGVAAPASGLRALGTRLRSPLALPAAAAALVAGAAHVPVTPEHLEEVPYVGRLFVALAVVCVAGGLLLAVRDVVLVWAGLAAANLAAVVLFVVSRGPGMPGMSDDIGDWTNELGIISVASESLVVVLALVALARAGALNARLRQALPAGVAVLGLALAAGGYATGLLAG